MEEEYMETQELGEANRAQNDCNEPSLELQKDFENSGFDESFEDDDGGGSFRGGGRGRANFRGRGRGPPPGWGGPPMRFRGRGYGPGGPPMRGRGFFRGRGGPRFQNGPNFDNNWGPMGPPPPGMMGGPPPFGPPPGMMPPGGPMGPPPNMMGQPPFGGPPGMPPNMPGPELWVETKSEDGKSYYYHSRTRETTWTRPTEGPNVKVITQAEMEAMAATGQIPGMGNQMPSMNGPMGMMNNGMPPMGGMMNPAPGSLPPFMTQPPPWVKDGNKDKQDGESPDECDDMPPGEMPPVSQAPSQQANNMGGFPPPGSQQNNSLFPSAANMQGPPGGAPGGFQWPPAWGSWPPPMTGQPPPMTGQPPPMSGQPPPMTGQPPPMTGQPPPMTGQPPPMTGQPPPMTGQTPQQRANNMMAGMPGPMGAGGPPQMGGEPPGGMDQPPPAVQHQPPAKPETVIPPEVAARAAEWTTHRAPDGRPYYYNAGKQESVWEKPEPLKELEKLQAKIAVERGEKPDKRKLDIDDAKVIGEVVDVDAYEEAQAAAAEAERAAEEQRRQQQEKERLERERLEKEKQEKDAAEKERLEKEKAKQDRSRPISTTPISGTPWCVVWTGDGRVFFYNPTAHSSVWERPPQLIGRADVDRAVANPPPALTMLLRGEAAGVGLAGKAANGQLKRSADSSTDDSDTEPAKKNKQEDKKATSAVAVGNQGKIDAGKEAAIEAEVRAARERALVPLEQRMRAFRSMLEDNDVSAFSTWEKELHKIVFDPRYLLLTSKERKQVFDKYVRERAEEERKEKKNRIQAKKTAFRQLMEDAKLHAKSSYTDFSSKHGRDERYKAIEKARDRETYFNEFLAELRKREKEEKERRREQAKTEFIAMLKEKTVDRHLRWAEAKKKVDSDARYKAVDSSALKEDYFREYCKIVKDERKKEKDSKDKERDRSSSKKEKKDKDREKDKEKEKEKDREREKEREKEKERDKDTKEKKKEKPVDEDKEKEPAKEEPKEETEGETGAESEGEAARAREARAQASIKEREREVHRALATSLRDRDKEREYHKRDEAVQHFNALLADLVRNPELAWRDAKKQLKKDHRYSLADLLSKEDKERLFSQHITNLTNKRRDKFRSVLNELGVSCTAHWRDVRAKLKSEPTAPQYCSSSQMEREFREYQRDKQSASKTALRQLLLETRSISHKTLAATRDHPPAMQQLHESLKHDARYLALEHIPEEREAIIVSYLEELAKKGPPPPPTATEPARRAKQ